MRAVEEMGSPSRHATPSSRTTDPDLFRSGRQYDLVTERSRPNDLRLQRTPFIGLRVSDDILRHVPRLEPVREVGLYIPLKGGPVGHRRHTRAPQARLAALMSDHQVHFVSHGDIPEGKPRAIRFCLPSLHDGEFVPFEEQGFHDFINAGTDRRFSGSRLLSSARGLYPARNFSEKGSGNRLQHGTASPQQRWLAT